ncbi:MAG: type I 3-dehydroquinate dehydratase [Deltaproteobacteria bacterium]|nr:type I 3-dehydroquinate dehydratase [Deltaproteobacteria bacterium]
MKAGQATTVYSNKLMICIPIIACNTSDALEKMALASAHCDLMEVRLDVMEAFDLSAIIASASRPVMITYRSIKEGGEGGVPCGACVDYLKEAIRLGADYVDVEYAIPLEYRRLLFEKRGQTKLILSKHFQNETPSTETLTDLFGKMAATGADIVKIVTYAKTPADNLTVLGLIPLAAKRGVEMIALCMGSLGRISRVACPLLGGAFTFASLERGQESASGQMTVKEMNRVLEVLSR